MSEWSPNVELTTLTTVTGIVTVVRDDLLQGGTKQRAAIPFLQGILKGGVREFVYASPFSGFAQVALAKSCHAIGVKCTVFAERDLTKSSPTLSEFTRRISQIANIQLTDSLESAEQMSIQYAEQVGAHKIPLGFNDPLFRFHLTRELRIQWEWMCERLGFIPRRLWVSVGSGTLATVFRQFIPDSTTLACVGVRVLSEDDERIRQLKSLINVEYTVAPQPFSEPVLALPPVPSNRFYDAKLWEFIRVRATTEEVWWNVAS